MKHFWNFRNINHIEKLKNNPSLQHANINFSSEIKMNNSLKFLNIKIIRKNNKFTISVYRKPTFSIIFTNFYTQFVQIRFNFSIVTQSFQTML